MPYDRKATTERLFQAAAEEFARSGVAGARMDAIAESAGASKALIYTYFGNKEQLFGYVITEKLSALAESAVLRPDDIGHYVADVFAYLAAEPQLIRFMQHEAVHYQPTDVPGFADRSQHYRRRIDGIRQAQATGVIDPELDPEATFLAIMGMVNWFFSAPQITAMVLGDPQDPVVQERFLTYLLGAVRRLVAPRGQAAAQHLRRPLR